MALDDGAEPRGRPQADPGRSCRRPREPARFLLEAEITGGLEHPGIVPVYGLGQYDDGRPYYAMRFIHGDSLRTPSRRLPRGRPRADRDPGRAITGAAPAARPVHRRLRRDGLCAQPRRAPPRPEAGRTSCSASSARPWSSTGAWPSRWTDMRRSRGPGPAATRSGRSRPRSSGGRSRRLAGSAFGTPQFMSPEQAAGDARRSGPGQRRLQPGRHALLPADRPAPVPGR